MKEIVPIVIKTLKQDVELQISKISCINISTSDKNYLYFDQLKNGTWRLVYTKGILKE